MKQYTRIPHSAQLVLSGIAMLNISIHAIAYSNMFLCTLQTSICYIFNVRLPLPYMTLDHKTSLKCQLFKIEIYTSSEAE